MNRIAGCFRAVQNGRRVEPDITGLSQTNIGPTFFNHTLYFAFGDQTQPVRSRRDQKRCVGRWYGVEMDAQRHHASQQIERRRDVDALSNSDRSILMPGKRPVGRSRLVEKDRPDGMAGFAEDRGSYVPNRARRRKQSPHVGIAMKSYAGLIRGQVGDRLFKLPQFRRAEGGPAPVARRSLRTSQLRCEKGRCSYIYPIGFNPASIAARRGSRNGGSASFSPSVASGSSVAKPGPSVAISNRMPLGSRK
jgi:hypothetical protein